MEKLSDVLVNHPYWGSVWLSDARIEGKSVVGEAWDDSGRGAPNYPDDWRGQPCTMNFPISCIRKDPDDLLMDAAHRKIKRARRILDALAGGETG